MLGPWMYFIGVILYYVIALVRQISVGARCRHGPGPKQRD